MLKKSLTISIFAIITIFCGFLVGCSTFYDKGKFENRFMRVEHEPNHASMERFEGLGTAVESVGANGSPTFWIGKYAHTQLFLPKMLCTTYYKEDGVLKEKMICETVPPLSVEAQLSATGGRVGDIIKAGDATQYGSSYTAWIANLKAQVKSSSVLKPEVKDDYLETLDEMSGALSIK